jgi:hypothetical protein
MGERGRAEDKDNEEDDKLIGRTYNKKGCHIDIGFSV